MSDQDQLETFKKNVIARLEGVRDVYGWLDKPGDIIQCSPSALQRAKFYVMGFNPGGDSAGKSLRTTIEELRLDSDSAHPLRRWKGWSYLTKLAEALQREQGQPRDGWEKSLFITNLFPDKEPEISGWKAQHPGPFLKYVEAMWPVHELMLSFVQPRFVIVLGIQPVKPEGSAFSYLWHFFQDKHRQNDWNESMSPVTREDPQIKTFDIGPLDVAHGIQLPRVTFIGIPHLSRSQPNIDVLRKLLQTEDEGNQLRGPVSPNEEARLAAGLHSKMDPRFRGDDAL